MYVSASRPAGVLLCIEIFACYVVLCDEIFEFEGLRSITADAR